eukprot:9019777-Pyramimonas_sp.AAC.1
MVQGLRGKWKAVGGQERVEEWTGQTRFDFEEEDAADWVRRQLQTQLHQIPAAEKETGDRSQAS